MRLALFAAVWLLIAPQPSDLAPEIAARQGRSVIRAGVISEYGRYDSLAACQAAGEKFIENNQTVEHDPAHPDFLDDAVRTDTGPPRCVRVDNFGKVNTR